MIPTLTAGRQRALLALLAALLYLPGLGAHDLWNPDEPRYAEVAREMMADGELFLPHLNGEIYAQKPPLHFWAISLAALARGQLDETAVRLPSALAAIGTLLLLFAIAERFFDRRVAWLSVAALATCEKLLWQARFGQIDMMLTFIVTLALYFWVRGFLERRPGFYQLFFALTGVATITKGPVGMLPPLLSVAVFLLAIGERRELARMRVGRGLLLWLAVVLAWLVPAGLRGGGEYVRYMVLFQNVNRYFSPAGAGETVGHLKPWYYYLMVLAVEFLPWSFLLPATLGFGARRLRGLERRGLQLALCWIGVTLVFFSLSPGKRSVYILPLYPALALVTGVGLDRLARAWPRHRGWLAAPLAGFALVFAAAAAWVGRVAGGRPELAHLDPDFARDLALVLLLLAGGLAAGAWWSYRGRVLRAVGALAGGMVLFSMAAWFGLTPRVDPVKSSRPLAEALRQRLEPGEAYAMYPKIEPGILFYSERFADIRYTEEELRDFLDRGAGRLVVGRRPDIEVLSPPLVEVFRDRAPEEGWSLLVMPPPAAGAPESDDRER